MARIALYGNVGLVRTFCQDCQWSTLVLNGIKQCCDKTADEVVEGVEQIVPPEIIRRTPSRKRRNEILHRQHDLCAYCNRRFGSTQWYKGKQIVLRVNFDHVLPLEFSLNNSLGNFVAACHICNNWKSDHVFNYLEEIQVYVTEKWERVETDVGKNLPSMRDRLLD